MIETDKYHKINSASFVKRDLNYTVRPDWEQLLNTMTSISLDQLQDYSLMRRFDSKYLVPEKKLLNILHSITKTYSVLEIQETRLNPYLTTYYDSSDFLFYRQHHNGFRKRCKVRTRTYLSTQNSFLEIKQKGSNNQSVKQRIPIASQKLKKSQSINHFIDKFSPISQEMLEEKLKNQFMRFTLVNRYSIERVTIDLGLTFFNNHKKVVLPGMAVVEVKKEQLHNKSALESALHTAHINPQGFSKYCIGISLLETQVKHNRFKKKIIQLKKLVSEGKTSYGIS